MFRKSKHSDIHSASLGKKVLYVLVALCYWAVTLATWWIFRNTLLAEGWHEGTVSLLLVCSWVTFLCLTDSARFFYALWKGKDDGA